MGYHRPGLEWIMSHTGHNGDGCLTWPFSPNRGGYGQFVAFGRFFQAHRFMCEKVHGAPPTPQHHAAHSCGNGHLGCVNPRHLSWETPSKNGVESRWHPRWKLTPEQVLVIRDLKGVEFTKVTAARYGVTEPTIRRIHTGETWRTGKREPGGFAHRPSHSSPDRAP